MNLISFDIGVKHLAYCILQYTSESSTYKILKWDIINLCNDDFKCKCATKKEGLCGKKASFMDNNNNYFCKVHAKQQPFKIPKSKITSIEKLKKEDLVEYAKQHNIVCKKTMTKKELIEKVGNIYEKEHLKHTKKVNGNKVNLIEMGIALKEKIDIILEEFQINKVVIENQIRQSMINIQYMLAQYFITKEIKDVTIFHACNKLNSFIEHKTIYEERKDLGVYYSEKILSKCDINNNWLSLMLKYKKKDDMGDSFLQALAFLRITENYIIKY